MLLLFQNHQLHYFLNKYNFELVEKEYFRNDHSIFYCVRKSKNIIPHLPEGLYEKNKSTFQKYIDNHLDDVNKINVGNVVKRKVIVNI